MSAIDAITSTASPKTPAGTDAYSALGSGDFLKIILSELSRQDPLKPNDTSALLQQLSTIRTIQSDVDLSDRLKSLVGQNEWASGAGLIGKGVSGISEEGSRVAGLVIGVSRTSSGAVLTLDDGTRVPMKSVDEIVNLAPKQAVPA